MAEVEFAELNIKEIACPKCGTVGRLTHFGKDYRGKYHRVFCGACKRTSSERQLTGPTETAPKPINKSNNNVNQRLDRLEAMLEQLIEGKTKPEPTKAKPKPEPKQAFDWDAYSEDRQMKIQQLVGILREHPDWGSIKLQKRLQELNMGLKKSDVVIVKNAFREGQFDGEI